MKNFRTIGFVLLALVLGVFTLNAQQPVKNIIFMIGDGMGLTQVSAAMYNAGQPLNMERAQYCGFVKTHSFYGRITDSAAASTALSTGTKTNNGFLGVDVDKNPLPTVLEKSSAAGYATGMVVTSSVTNATPAGFISHVDSRKKEDEVAAWYLETDIDLFMGGGKKFFVDREDGRNIARELEAKGYGMFFDLEEALAYNGPRYGTLLADVAMPLVVQGRTEDYLPRSTVKALDFLKERSGKGFFIMVEGSFIDKGGHMNDAQVVITEALDFDKAVGYAFDFADRNPGTLVVVTADHETGGMSIMKGEEKNFNYGFGGSGHSATMVPMFSYGAGAENFSGVFDNTDLPKIMCRLLGLE